MFKHCSFLLLFFWNTLHCGEWLGFPKFVSQIMQKCQPSQMIYIWAVSYQTYTYAISHRAPHLATGSRRRTSSILIAYCHSVLFFHNGQWCFQSGHSSSGSPLLHLGNNDVRCRICLKNNMLHVILGKTEGIFLILFIHLHSECESVCDLVWET